MEGAATVLWLVVVVACTLLGLLPVGVSGGGVRARRPAAMYVLGDSTLDVGNNDYLPGPDVPLANMPYNGIDFPGSIPTGRFCNGYNTADYVAKSMGFVSSPPAYLSLAPSSGDVLLVQAALSFGVSYASAGAGILDSTNAGNVIPLRQQVQYLNATKAKMVNAVGSRAVASLLSRSVVLIAVGSNDLFLFAFAGGGNVTALYSTLISIYSATITDLYAIGARKLAIMNTGALGCVPLVRAADPAAACSDGLNQISDGFDAALSSMMAGLAGTLPGLVYSIGDNLGLALDTFADPGSSGYTDVTGACCGSGRLGAAETCMPNSTLCGDRDGHVFWDRVHPTRRASFLTAKAFYDGPAGYTHPISFKQLAQATTLAD